MKKKPANMQRGKSTHPAERAVEAAAEKESWLRKLIRNTRHAKGRPDPKRKP